ncbi:MAG: hypothetical protein ABFD18_00055 [Syntrophomonas sp.]
MMKVAAASGVTSLVFPFVNALKAWTITKGSPRILIGVLDTGVDINQM